MNKFKSMYTDLKGLKWYEYAFLFISGIFLTLMSIFNLQDIPEWGVKAGSFIWESDQELYKTVMQVAAGIAAWTGIVTVFLVGKGKLSNYLYGFINAALYGVYAFSVGYTGDAILNILWFLPTQVVGFLMWNQNTDSTNTVKPKKLTLKTIAWMSVLTAIIFGAFWIIIPAVDVELNKNILKLDWYEDYALRNEMFPRVLDTLTNTLSVTATILMLQRYKEQWYVWIVINIAQISMYAGVNPNLDTINIPMLTMWGVFLINAVYSLGTWIKSERRLYG